MTGYPEREAKTGLGRGTPSRRAWPRDRLSQRELVVLSLLLRPDPVDAQHR